MHRVQALLISFIFLVSGCLNSSITDEIIKCKDETIYAFFNGLHNHVDGYHDLSLFGIYKNVEDGKNLVSKLENFAG